MSHFTSANLFGTVTLDETDGLQNSFTTIVAGDADDNDILYDSGDQSIYPDDFWNWLVSLGSDPLDVALSNYGTLAITGDYDFSGAFDAIAGGTSLTIDDGSHVAVIDLSGINNEVDLLNAISGQLLAASSDITASVNSDGLLVLTYNSPATSSTIEISGTGADVLGLPTGTFGTTDLETTKMVEINGSSLDPLRFSSDSSGTPLLKYDLDNPSDPTVGLDSGITDLDGNHIYLFELEGDSNIVVGIDETGELSLAVYLEQAITDGSTNLQARIWSAEFEPLRHPIPGDDDEAISLDDKLYLTSVDNLTFDASNSPSGQNLFIMFGEGDGTYDFGIIATGKEPVNESEPGSPGITAGDTINTSQAGGPTTFGVNNQMLTASSTEGEGDGIVFTYVTNTNSNYTVPNLDQNEADVEANIDFFGVFTADSATFDIVQLQGGKTAVAKITAIDSSNIDPGVDYIDGQLDDLAGLGTTTTIVDIESLTITGQRGKGNSFTDVEFVVEVGDVTIGVPYQVTDGDYSMFFTFNADGTVIIDGLEAGDNVEFTTDGDHNRVLIENWGDGSGQDSANFDIGGFQLLDIASETQEIGDKIFFEDDGPGLGLTAPELVEEEQINNAYSVGNEDYGVPLLDTDTVGDLNVVKHYSELDYNAVVSAGTDEQAQFLLDISGLPEDGVAYDSVSGLLKTGLTAGSTIDDLTYSIYDGTTTYDFIASGNTLQQLVDDINTNAGTVATADIIGGRLVLTSTDTDQLTLTNFEGVIYEAPPTLYSKGALVNFDVDSVVSVSGTATLSPTDTIPDVVYSIADSTTTYNFDPTGTTVQDLIDEINLGTVATADLVDGNLVLESVNGDPLTLTNFELFDSSLEDDTPYDTVTYTLTGTVVSITGAATLSPDDTIDDVVYSISDGTTTDNFDPTGDTVQDLIDKINETSSVATAALVDGYLVLESVTGDPLTLTNFELFDPSLEDATPYDSTRDVLTWSVTDDGMATFTVLDQVDHAAGSGENILLINLQGYMQVLDGDFDPIANLDDLGKYNVIDDVPIESGGTVTGTVEEEHGLAGGNEDTTGGVAPAVDADTLVGPDYDLTKNTVTGNLQSLVLVGTDEVLGGGATFGFADMTQVELDAAIVLLGLSSQDEPVTKATISGDTLTAKTDDGDEIFSLTVEENGDYTFTLIRTLDHDPTANGGDDTENLETIDLTGFIMATDFDGDEVVLGTSGEDSSEFLINVIDDIPIETGGFVTGTVEEEHGLTGGNEDTTGGTVGTVVIDGDTDNDNAALDGSYVLTPGAYSVVTSSGTTTFNAPGDGTELQDLIDAINTDGYASADIIGGDLIITSDEAVTLSGFQGVVVGLGDFVDGTPYVEGVDEDTASSGAGADVTTNAVSGNLQSLVSIGTDQVASDGGATFDFAFADDAALDVFIASLGLSSQDEDVTQADISGDTLTAKTADGDAIFTLTVADNGDYTFTLLRNLDNPNPGVGLATEDVLTIDLSGLIKAEDSDGDEIVLGSSGDASSFLIYAIDDIPILEVGNLLGTGTVDPQIGEWAGLPGADDFQSLSIVIDTITYGPSGGETVDDTDIPLGDPTVGPDGELIFTGAITGDFDGNATNGDETLNFQLTFYLDGTYVFNLEEQFVSSISFSSDDGQLPAGGPDSVQTLPVGDDDILFFALDPLAYADAAEEPDPDTEDYIVTDVLSPILNEAQLEALNPSFLDPAFLMNVSTSGIGVNNNNLQGDGITDITAGDQSFIVNPETELTSVQIFIDNSVGGYDPTTEELYYRVFFVDGTYSDFILVESGDLSPEAGGQESFTIDWSEFGETSMIDAVQVTMGLGKIKIPTIVFTQETALTLDPITIDFDATYIDGDDDSVTDDFSILVGTDDDPFIVPDIEYNGTADADAFNIDLASGLTDWVINGFDSTDGVELDGDKIVLLNPLFDYSLVTSNVGDDVITINGTTITVTNGTDELTADDILVAYSDTVIDGDILVGDTLNGDLLGTADADAFIVKEDLDELTGLGGGDAFVFIDPANEVNLITDFDSSEGDFLVISASGFGISVDEGPLSSDYFVSGSGATAADANDYFLFDTDTDELWFDADGDGLGESPVLIATFNFDSGTLTSGDILIIA